MFSFRCRSWWDVRLVGERVKMKEVGQRRERRRDGREGKREGGKRERGRERKHTSGCRDCDAFANN